MDITKLQQKADTLGLEYTFRTQKPQLVRKIQKRLGQQDCFATDQRFSCSDVCEWRADCKQPIAAWLR